jgi:hypothetical protein
MNRTAHKLKQQLSDLDRRRWESDGPKLWTHHVADLNGGEALTSVLDQPIGLHARAARVTQLLTGIGPSIFDGPSFTLTPRVPYQIAPIASLQAYGALQFSASLSQIWWVSPLETDDVARELTVSLAALPSQPSIVSVALIGNSHPGIVGSVVVSSNLGTGAVSLSIGDVYSAHTVDLVVKPLMSALKPDYTLISLGLGPGIQYLGFESVSFYPMAPLATI